MKEQPSITCPRCEMKSFNPNDIAEGYCGNCHWWTSNPTLERLYEVMAAKEPVPAL